MYTNEFGSQFCLHSSPWFTLNYDGMMVHALCIYTNHITPLKDIYLLS